MFDIGFAELLLLAIIGLLVIGPERLPETARTLGLWAGRMRRMFTAAKSELERELGVDDVRRQLHNEQVMSDLKALEKKATSSQQPDAQDAPSASSDEKPH